MLASITPLGERGRNNRYTTTATWFVVGAALGGLLAGTVTGAVGAALGAVVDPSPVVIGLALAVVALSGAIVEAGRFGVRLPTTVRQVDERWMDRYRGWVYGGGWGFQLGLAFVTVVNSAAVYVAFACALLTEHVAAGAVIGLTFGLVRGLSVFLSAPIRTPFELRTFHARFDRRQPATRVVAVVALGAIGMSALVAAVAA